MYVGFRAREVLKEEIYTKLYMIYGKESLSYM